MTIVLDAMGSDDNPAPELEAAVTAARLLGEEILLVGDETILEPRLKIPERGNQAVRILHAPDVVEMGDKAVESFRAKPRNSMAVGLEQVRDGKATAFVTAGNTGAAYFHAVTILKRLPGISRPALATPLPTKTGRCVLIDNGANADCRPDFLLEFAIMGSVFAEKVLGISNPRIALLANGEESSKGNQLVRDAYHLLESSGLNFIGNAEPKEIFGGHADVVVTDGYTGNILLKTSEAVAKFITDILKDEISASFTRKLGYLLVKPAFQPLKKKMDPAEVGAAMLLGVNGYTFIGHGRSDARALVNGLRMAKNAVDSNLLDALRQAIETRLATVATQISGT